MIITVYRKKNKYLRYIGIFAVLLPVLLLILIFLVKNILIPKDKIIKHVPDNCLFYLNIDLKKLSKENKENIFVSLEQINKNLFLFENNLNQIYPLVKNQMAIAFILDKNNNIKPVFYFKFIDFEGTLKQLSYFKTPFVINENYKIAYIVDTKNNSNHLNFIKQAQSKYLTYPINYVSKIKFFSKTFIKGIIKPALLKKNLKNAKISNLLSQNKLLSLLTSDNDYIIRGYEDKKNIVMEYKEIFSGESYNPYYFGDSNQKLVDFKFPDINNFNIYLRFDNLWSKLNFFDNLIKKQENSNDYALKNKFGYFNDFIKTKNSFLKIQDIFALPGELLILKRNNEYLYYLQLKKNKNVTFEDYKMFVRSLVTGFFPSIKESKLPNKKIYKELVYNIQDIYFKKDKNNKYKYRLYHKQKPLNFYLFDNKQSLAFTNTMILSNLNYKNEKVWVFNAFNYAQITLRPENKRVIIDCDYDRKRILFNFLKSK